jgi:hypothetical protein
MEVSPQSWDTIDGSFWRKDDETQNFVLFFSLPCRIGNCSGAARAPSASEAEFVSLAARCAPGTPPDTLLAIARTESGLNPNAISINRPKAAARLGGHADGELVLGKQPKDRTEANSWLRWLSIHRYTVSIGLMIF